MKTAFVLLTTSLLAVVGASAQGLIRFNNLVSGGVFRAPTYGVEPGDPTNEKHGNPATGIPSGLQVYNGPLLSGAGYTAQLWGHVGAGLPASSLMLLATTTFRTGTAAGYLDNAVDVPVPGAPIDGNPYSGTFQLRVWDNLGGTITDWSQVAADPQILRGESEVFTVGPLGGTGTVPTWPPPALFGMTSFNLHTAPGPGGTLLINDILVAEGTNGTINALFSVRLPAPITETVTVDYTTASGTAVAGSDYVATNGSLTFLPGETNKLVTVVVTADVNPEPDESFTVVLSNPINAAIGRDTGTATITEARINGLVVDVSVTFHTVLGHIYQLEKTDVLMTLPWAPVAGATNIVGTGGNVTAIDRGSGCDTGRIYRARLIQ